MLRNKNKGIDISPRTKSEGFATRETYMSPEYDPIVAEEVAQTRVARTKHKEKREFILKESIKQV